MLNTDLELPPELPKHGLRIVPLGGLGEIGRNMTVFEAEGRLLVVDCGVLFPEDYQPGVDLILPDFSYIADRLDDIDALVLTHGHEDHIGAVPYLLKMRPDIPIVGSKFTIALTTSKLKEHRIEPISHVVTPKTRVKVGPFECGFIPVSHSIPGCFAVTIKSQAGTVLHTGDFKMDQLPVGGEITDIRGLSRLADDGVDLLMVDSTNADVPGFTPSESGIGPVLENLVAQAPRRVIVASFSSHVYRIQQVVDAAVKHGRQVAFIGRSMVNNMGIAQELGYLKIPEGTVIDQKQIDDYPEDRVLIVCTGSQGETMAALSRMARNDHKFSVAEDDLVVLSASLIPGNESAVYSMVNGLIAQGAKVVTNHDAHVHVSGHAASGDILLLLNVVQPANVMPVHGEIRHLKANAGLAEKTGVAADRLVIGTSGTVVDLVDGVAKATGQVECGYVYVDGSTVGEITEDDLKDRRILSGEGFISIFSVIYKETGKLATQPVIHARGFAEHDLVFDDVIPQIESAFADLEREDVQDVHLMQQRIRRTVGRWVNKEYRRRPMIVPVVVGIDSPADTAR